MSNSRFVLLVLIAPLFAGGCSKSTPRVVVYCAQDEDFAKSLFGDFTKQSGLPIAPNYDTEAGKSFGLVKELALEVKRPRCDVHWNNEIIGTIKLQRQGVYEPYISPSAEPYPAEAKSADHTWTAFASRARIIVVNTQKVAEADRPKGLFDLTDAKWKGKIAIAKPLFGTTSTQAAALFAVLGPVTAKDFYRGLKANDVHVVAGNKDVAVGVAKGEFAVGLTDTDDALEEIADGKPLAMIFPDRDGDTKRPELGVLYIPNTIAVVKGCPNPAGAKQLVDYLLSAEVEAKLADGPSHQFPMNPKVKAKLPAILAMPDQVKTMKVDWEKAADRWDESQRFLADEFGR